MKINQHTEVYTGTETSQAKLKAMQCRRGAGRLPGRKRVRNKTTSFLKMELLLFESRLLTVT